MLRWLTDRWTRTSNAAAPAARLGGGLDSAFNRYGRERPAARTGNDTREAPPQVWVTGKDAVMKVFLNAEGNYSVSGYNERAALSFGRIYLGLDKGPDYDRQATAVNASIQTVTGVDAFAVALRITRDVVATKPPTADDMLMMVLARLCAHWFDLPNGIHVFEGDVGNEKPSCPIDYVFPSGHIFRPEPEWLTELGIASGKKLKRGVLQYVRDMKASGQLPKGVLSRAVFEALAGEDDDLIARTIIGVMMGKVPTVLYNLKFVLDGWRADGTFAALQQALSQHTGTDAYARAKAVLNRPLMRAIQAKPEPGAVWRTAVRDHTLATSPPITIPRGCQVNVSIESATNADLATGITDVFPVFGGNRHESVHPTHACPGYEMAMGIMLGTVNGVLEPA